MRPGPRGAVAATVLVAVALRLPYLRAPLTSDEAGYLMVAHQWAPGTSLYGDYWVDRPPLLIGWFGLADRLARLPHVDAAVALHLLGVAVAAGCVLLAALLGRRTAPAHRWAPALTAAVCAALVSTPLVDMTLVDGELLALPFVLGGLLLVHEAARAPRLRTAALLGLAAGAVGMAGALVKQNVLGVLVVLGLVCLVLLRRPGERRRALLLAAAGGAGAVLMTVLVVLWARAHGTDPLGLWHAVVTFRARAAQVISASATDATPARGRRLALVVVLTGAPALLLLLRPGRRDDPDASPVVALPVVVGLLVWEAIGVAGGGSYWLHYLVGLVPSLTLVMAAYCRHRPGSLRRPALTLVPLLVSLVAASTVQAVAPPTRSTDDQAVVDYLRSHEAPGDTGVVAFGNPALLRAAHLGSPYPELWSLPVRVRDPRLRHFAALLRDSDRAPTWVLQYGAGLGSWGLDATRADAVLARRYRRTFVSGDLEVYRRLAGREGRLSAGR